MSIDWAYKRRAHNQGEVSAVVAVGQDLGAKVLRYLSARVHALNGLGMDIRTEVDRFNMHRQRSPKLPFLKILISLNVVSCPACYALSSSCRFTEFASLWRELQGAQ
jgi:hypothetical protein